MRRRLDRDRNRIHQYHSDLHLLAQKKLAALAGSAGEKAENDRKRETLRIATIEREYAAKLGDLRHNYALRVSVEWVQGLELFVPVQRFEVLVKRRKGEKLMRLDWHPAVRLMEPPPSDWGLGIGRSRLVCDDQLHITDPAGQSPCPSCGRAWCRACHPTACPRCGHAIKCLN
jgi:selenocysteine lyase/cysteine desulfurase